MEILFIGDLSLITDTMFDNLEGAHQIIGYDVSNKAKLKSKKVTAFHADKMELEELMKVFVFHTVIYISESINSDSDNVERIGLLENILTLSGKHGVSHAIILSNNCHSSMMTQSNANRGLSIINDAMVEICKNASQYYEMSVQILKVPYIYKATRNADSHAFFWHASNEKKVVLPGDKSQIVDFVCETDLTELLSRMIDEETPNRFQIMHASGENVYTLEEIGERLRKQIPNLQVVYGEYNENIPKFRRGETARREYGYFPEDVLEETFENIVPTRKLKLLEKMERALEKQSGHKITDLIRIAFELVVFWVLCEIVGDSLRDNSFLNFIDFRLIYILLMGVSEGMLAGIIASILSCVGFTMDNMEFLPWQLIVYNVQNWIPYGAYFLAGSISGYLTDKSKDELEFQKEEYEILEQKYHSLSEIYDEVRKGKEAFNRQIISYRDSYGKLYNIVKKLNELLPEKVFFEAIMVLEEMLETKSVAIYSIPKESQFARLVVCSSGCTQRVRKSVHLSEFSDLIKFVESGSEDIYVNRDALDNYPAYAVPIMRNEMLVGGILIMDVNADQLSMEFMNKFRIVTALIRDSLLRAMEYQDSIDQSEGGLVVLNAEHFREVLKVNVEMKRNHLLEFMLLKLITDEDDMQRLSDKLCKIVRASDTVGFMDDGSLYLMLAQANKDDSEIVGSRLKNLGIDYETFEDVEWYM